MIFNTNVNLWIGIATINDCFKIVRNKNSAASSCLMWITFTHPFRKTKPSSMPAQLRKYGTMIKLL